MNWYSANILISFRPRQDSISCPILVWENIVLLEGPNVEAVRKKAEQFGEDSVSVWTDVSFLQNKEPMVECYEGVRKIARIECPKGMESEDCIPAGTRISRSLFEVSNSAGLASLVKDESCRVKYFGSFNQISESVRCENEISRTTPIPVTANDSPDIPLLWSSAHILIALTPVDDVHSKKHVQLLECIFLVGSHTVGEAWDQAKRIGVMEESSLDSVTVNGCHLRPRFAGVRRLVTIDNKESSLSYHLPLVSETEITFSEFEVASAIDVQKMINDEDVFVEYKKGLHSANWLEP